MVNKVFVCISGIKDKEEFLKNQSELFGYGFRWNSDTTKEFRDISSFEYIIIEDGIMYNGAENIKNYLIKEGYTLYPSLNQLFRFMKLYTLKQKIKSVC